ncbi:MAG: hypothetical protein ACUVS4_07865 [Chloroflexaceae bacterium]
MNTNATSQQPLSDARQPGRNWGLWALVGGAALLIIIALLTIPLSARQQPVFAPLSTPEGVVQRFFDAVYRGDYAGAYGFLSANMQRERSLAEFQNQIRYARNGEMRVDRVAIHDDTATVTVTVTRFEPGGIFGGNQWSTQYDLLLERDGESWRIVSWPLA